MRERPAMSKAYQETNVSTFRLRRRTPGSFLLVPCPKQGRAIRCQGQLEGAAATILVACPQVTHIREQPFSVWYSWDTDQQGLQIDLLDKIPERRTRNTQLSGTSHIVPDFLVQMLNGPWRLVEVKPSHRLDRPVVKRKLAVARRLADENGWRFHVVTEKELFQGSLLANVRLINRYQQANLNENDLNRLMHQVPPDGIELSVLLHRCNSNCLGQARMRVFHLLATGRLSFDPCAGPLGDPTPIFPEGVILWDPFDSLWAHSGSSTSGSGGSSVSSPPTASLPKM
jgi:hypothetical protein